jgi:hypothetical protein
MNFINQFVDVEVANSLPRCFFVACARKWTYSYCQFLCKPGHSIWCISLIFSCFVRKPKRIKAALRAHGRAQITSVCNHGSAKCVHTKEPDKCPVIIQSKSVSGMCLCCTTTPWSWSCRAIKLTTQVLGGHKWIDQTLEWLLSGSWGPCESMHGLCAPHALITILQTKVLVWKVNLHFR